MSVSDGAAPDRVMQIMSGGWAAAIMGTSARYGVFEVLEAGGADAETVAQKTGVSVRGAQALLDGLAGAGLVKRDAHGYINTPEASAYLIKGKPTYLGGMAEVTSGSMGALAALSEIVKLGGPLPMQNVGTPNNDFWELLVPAIAGLSQPVAKLAADRLGIAGAGAVRWLDVGGGSGIWSAVWLAENPQATGTQLDWPIVNSVARKFVGSFGVADRFQTLDGDLNAADFGEAQYDYAIFAHVAHQDTPEANLATFRKFRRALKPGGTLVVNDFILDDERTGHPFAMLFSSQMLIGTTGGFTYRQADYRKWLTEAGFASVEYVPTPTPASFLLAK